MNTLVVGTSYSRCSACGQNADPAEDAHLMNVMEGAGCGEPYTGITSDYIHVTAEMLNDINQLLPVVGIQSGEGAVL